jgi:hypothetical protein
MPPLLSTSLLPATSSMTVDGKEIGFFVDILLWDMSTLQCGDILLLKAPIYIDKKNKFAVVRIIGVNKPQGSQFVP